MDTIFVTKDGKRISYIFILCTINRFSILISCLFKFVLENLFRVIRVKKG